MMRAGLLLYLMLATAVGPGLCCCLADGFGSLPKKGTPKNSCCPKHDQGKEKFPAKSPSGPCSCPCTEDRVSPNLPRTIDRNDVFGQASFPFVFVVGIPSAQPLIVDANIAGTNPRNLPFTCLSAQEILRAIHVLLC